MKRKTHPLNNPKNLLPLFDEALQAQEDAEHRDKLVNEIFDDVDGLDFDDGEPLADFPNVTNRVVPSGPGPDLDEPVDPVAE